MTSTPRISVLMAVHNGMPTLPEAVESILAQTMADFEFVVVDDGSTDGSAQLLVEFARQDPRIRLLRNPVRMNLPTSLNAGLRACAAPLVARIDADDVAKPHRLATQVAYLDAHPEIGVLGSGCRHIDDANRFVGATSHPLEDARIRVLMAFWCCMVHPAVVFRRHLVEQVGGYDESLWTGQDYDLWARLLPLTGMANLPEELLLYRVHGRSITQSPERQAMHLELTAPVHRTLMSQFLQHELTNAEALAVRCLVMADQVMDDAAIDRGLPLLDRYVAECRRREPAAIADEFCRLAAQGLLAQSYYQKSGASRFRRRLYLKSLALRPSSIASMKGLRATAGVALPSSVWRMVVRLR